MPYRPKDIYRGRRKFRVPLSIFLFVLVFVLVSGVSIFFFLQQYVVYDDSGAHLHLERIFQRQEKPTAESEQAEATPESTFEPVPVNVIWEDPDFSDVDMGGWQDLSTIQARFIPLQEVVGGGLDAAVSLVVQDSTYSGAVLELKDSSGQLAWPSEAAMAQSYGTYGGTDVLGAVAALHDAGKTAVAQISCFPDNLLCQRNWTVALQLYGNTYIDSSGKAWLDPYNQSVRTYITDLAGELSDMGFDEIILADLEHPITDVEGGFTYTGTLRTPPNPVVAVCQMGRRVAMALAETDTAVSVLLNESSLQQNLGTQTGQDIPVFWRLFARLYCPTSPDQLAGDLEMAVDKMNGGEADVRFVPVMGLFPEVGKSYVIAG